MKLNPETQSKTWKLLWYSVFSFEFRLLMRICLKHKFGTFFIKRLTGVVPYVVHIALVHLVRIQILLTNLIQSNLGLKGNRCYFKLASRKSEILCHIYSR